jgi:hypothetical protein
VVRREADEKLAETPAVKLAEKQGNLALPKLYIAIKLSFCSLSARISQTQKKIRQVRLRGLRRMRFMVTSTTAME